MPSTFTAVEPLAQQYGWTMSALAVAVWQNGFGPLQPDQQGNIYVSPTQLPRLMQILQSPPPRGPVPIGRVHP